MVELRVVNVDIKEQMHCKSRSIAVRRAKNKTFPWDIFELLLNVIQMMFLFDDGYEIGRAHV